MLHADQEEQDERDVEAEVVEQEEDPAPPQPPVVADLRRAAPVLLGRSRCGVRVARRRHLDVQTPLPRAAWQNRAIPTPVIVYLAHA